MKLDECRKKIDSLDAAIVDLLNQRAAVAKSIGAIKAKAGLPVADIVRETEILARISQSGAGVLETGAIGNIFAQILSESRNLQAEVIREMNLKNGVVQR